MKPDKKADDLLRKKLNSYSSPVPAGLFDAMDKRREEQQAAGAFGWRVKAGLSAMALLLIASFAYWQINTNDITKSNTTIVDNKEQVADITIIENNQTQSIAQTQIEKEITQQNSNTQATNTKEKVFNTQQQTKSSNSSAYFPNEVVSTTTKESDVLKQIASIKIPTGDIETSLIKNDSGNTSINNSILPSDNVETDGVLNEVDVVTQRRAGAGQSILVSPLNRKKLLVDNRYHAAMPKIKCGWEARKVYLYFDAITSIDMAFRRLSPKVDDGESEAYAILRNKTEGMQESSSLGFRASAVTRGGFAMRTGLIYSTIKEPFSQIIYEEEMRIVTTEDGNGTVLHRDTFFDTITKDYKFANRHKLLDVPVIFGYEIDKDKYNIGFNGGAYINVTATQEGRFLTPNNEIVDFSTNSPARYEAFKTNVGVSMYSSIAVNYKITPALHFIFEPYGRYYMNSFTTNNHELDQNYFVAGMQVGLRMKM